MKKYPDNKWWRWHANWSSCMTVNCMSGHNSCEESGTCTCSCTVMVELPWSFFRVDGHDHMYMYVPSLESVELVLGSACGHHPRCKRAYRRIFSVYWNTIQAQLHVHVLLCSDSCIHSVHLYMQLLACDSHVMLSFCHVSPGLHVCMCSQINNYFDICIWWCRSVMHTLTTSL